VRISNLRQAHIYIFFFSYLVPDKLVEAFQADAGLTVVLEVVVITDLKEIIAVIEDAYPNQRAIHLVHTRNGLRAKRCGVTKGRGAVRQLLHRALTRLII
jgi:hypothetical protein